MELASHAVSLLWKIVVFYISLRNNAFGKTTTDEVCDFIDYYGKKENSDQIECSQNRVCQKTFRISNIRIPPYNLGDVNEYYKKDIVEILQRCCGHCVSYEEIRNFMNISEVTPALLNSSDFVHPFLATASTTRLHGFHFIPYEDPSTFLYITKNKHGELLKSIFNLYPVFIVCILLAVISGFIGWILETWSNEHEFPRSFFIGWFEGFWWSFISMTTVGYGDKCPKTILAKLFSIIWIFIGIIACGIITGEITGQVIKANSPPPASMKGAKVGALQYRNYDILVIAQHGGIVKLNEKEDAIDFNMDVLNLITKLYEDQIDGFILDIPTLMHVTDAIETALETVDDEDYTFPRGKFEFFTRKTIRVEKSYEGERYTYGILVKNKEDFEYFNGYIRSLRDLKTIRYAIDFRQYWEDTKEQELNDLYSSDYALLFSPSKYFKHSIMAIASMIGFILVFGFVYELTRRKYITCKQCLNN